MTDDDEPEATDSGDRDRTLFAGCLVCWILATRNALVPGGLKKRGWPLTAVMLTVGLGSLVAAEWQGEYLDSESYLHEPFYLIGSGSLLCLAGTCLTVALLLRGVFRRGVAVSGGAK